jgi:signal transduction histidine kinase
MNADSTDQFGNANAGEPSTDGPTRGSTQVSTHVWIARPDGGLDYANGCWRLFAGRSSTEMLSHGWRHLVHPDDLGDFLNVWREACRAKSTLRTETRLLSADGSARRFLIRAEPLTDERGVIVNWQGVNTMLADAVPGEPDSDGGAPSAEDLSEVMTRVRTRMAASANHDLRRPLSAVSFLSNSLAKRLRDPISRDLLSAMVRAVESMQSLVDNQLYFDQVDTGQVQPRLIDHGINSSLVRLANEFTPMAERKGLGFTLHPCSATIRTDPALLDTMLTNLVCNALRYTVEGRVVVGCRRQGNWLRVHVLDTGRGIAAEELGLIWQDFFRSSRSVQEYPGGYGLGLSVVKRLAERLGHQVEVTTTPNRGSCFTIKIPLSDRAASLPHGEPSVTTQPLAGLRVLVVDADATALNAVRLLVEEWGGTVRSARGVAEAEDLLASGSFQPDAILADFRLGGTANGILAMHKLTGMVDHAFKTPVRGVILTEENTAVREREIALAGYGMIAKAISPETLYRTLAAVTRNPDPTPAGA